MANPSKPRNRSSNNFDRLFGTAQGSRQSSSLLLIDRERIETGPQPRRDFAPDELAGLAASIRDLRARGQGVEGTGILQPLIVSALPQERFRLIAGERRLRASALAEVLQVPAVVVPLRADGLLVTQLVENLQRADLSPLEEADAVAQLAEEQGLSVRGIAEALGKDRGWVQNRVRLRKAAPDVRELLSQRRDSIPHAFEIERVADPKVRASLIEIALAGASVAEVRRRIEGPTESAQPEALEVAEMQRGPNVGAKGSNAGTRVEQHAHSQGSSQANTRSENERQGKQEEKQGSPAGRDPIENALQPAAAFVAEAERLLQDAHLSIADRARVLRQLDVIEAHLSGIRKIAAGE